MDKLNLKKYGVTTNTRLQNMAQIIEDKNKMIKQLDDRIEFFQNMFDKYLDSYKKRDIRYYEEELMEIAEDTETHIEFSKYFKQTLKKISLIRRTLNIERIYTKVYIDADKDVIVKIKFRNHLAQLFSKDKE